MLNTWKNVEIVVKHCAKVKANERVLIVADDHGSSMKMAQQLAETCTSQGAEVVVMVMAPRKYNGHEPPASVAAAMLEVDVVFVAASAGPPIVHTTAAKASREKGIRQILSGARSEAVLDREMSLDYLKEIQERTERVAEILTRTNTARITCALGTDLTMSLKGRPGLSLHPLSGAAVIVTGDYGEAAISPVEGTTEGVLVSDGGFLGWPLPPAGPVRLTVKQGRVTDVSAPEDALKLVKEFLATDANATNCAAELGIGTSRTAVRRTRGGVGTVHIACGRNNDIGGQTLSKVHDDLHLGNPTLWLDDVCLIKDGKYLDR
jgi:leucyl aminopeptidase (aminopeptidase T)